MTIEIRTMQIAKAFFGAVLTFGFAVAGSATEPPITHVAFAPDGKSLAAVSQSGFHVFSWPQLNRQRTVPTNARNLHCVAFSPDGKKVAVGGGDPSENGGAEVFTWPACSLSSAFGDHDDSVRSLVWLDNSRMLTASMDREIKLWDLGKSDTPVGTLLGHSRSVDAICILKNGKTIVSAGVDQSVRVWNLESKKLIRSMSQHTKPVHSLALRPAKEGLPMIASASGDRTIRFWQPTIGRMVRYARLDAIPLDLVWLQDGQRIAAACVDGKVRLIDANEVKVTQMLPAIEGWAYAIAVHPTDGTLAVGGSGGQLKRIHLSTDAP